MKQFNHLVMLVALLLPNFLWSQTPSDCCGAMPIPPMHMNNPEPVVIPTFQGAGAVYDPVEQCSACIKEKEQHSWWFSFTCVQSGSFNFLLNPDGDQVGFMADFDFALFQEECPCGMNSVELSCDDGPLLPIPRGDLTGIASNPQLSFPQFFQDPPATPFQPSVGLIEGQTYYLYVNNTAAWFVGFRIYFQGSAVITTPTPPMPPIEPGPGPIVGPKNLCPNTLAEYAVPPSIGQNFHWTIDPPNGGFVLENGTPFPTITWEEEGVYDLCVEILDGCTPNTNQNCEQIVIAEIPPTFAEANFCLGESYTASNGQSFFVPGVYNIDLVTDLGCDSTVILTLEGLAPSEPTFMEDEICQGECVLFGGAEICESGVYNKTYDNVDGCDSIVTFLLVTLPFEIKIEPELDTINCVKAGAVFDASESIVDEDAHFEWTNAFGVVVDTTPIFEAVEGGIYTLEVIASYGCSGEMLVEVMEDTQEPIAEAFGSEVSCVAPTTQISGFSPSNGAMYNWVGPNNFTSNEQNPMVEEAGTYELIVTIPNGCTAIDFAEVVGDLEGPEIFTEGGVLDCSNNSVLLSVMSFSPGVTYEWSGPGGFTSTEQNPNVNLLGTYTVTATGPNGCTAEEFAIVSGDNQLPTVSATGGTITCNETAVQLSGSSTTAGVTYEWSGPNNFSSSEQNPTITVEGTYLLTVIAPNGCTAETGVSVTADVGPPQVQATGGTLNCNINNLQLSGNSSTSGAMYAWTGPNNFNSNQQNPSVAIAGNYTLTVTGPNGCIDSETVEVLSDTTTPEASATGGTITCATTAVQLGGNSGTAGVSYAWTGPNNFNSSQQNPTVTSAGNYVLIVTATNGCTAETSATVGADTQTPDVGAIGGTITCSETEVQLAGNSATDGVTYEWTGPNNFMSDEQNPLVANPGNYTLTVTAANGCTAEMSATVGEDTAIPNVSAEGGTISCNILETQLNGSSSTAGVSYEWTGVDNFMSNEPNPVVEMPGNYTLTVTATNGCVNSIEVLVIADFAPPLVSATGGTIDCNNGEVQLSSDSDTGISYEWTGPNNFMSDEQSPVVTEGGIYTITATAANGCTDTATTEVILDNTPPDAVVIGGMIDCYVSEIMLSGNSTTENVIYEWTGPDNFMSDEQNPSVTIPGNYILTITAPNGCTTSANTEVGLDETPPMVSVTGGLIDCANQTLQLMSTVSNPNVTYAWIGPDNFMSEEQNPMVTAGGTYSLIVTTPNGCTAATGTEVEEDLQFPLSDFSAVIDGAEVTFENLSSFATSFDWDFGDGMSNMESNPVYVYQNDGTYIVTLTATNDCGSVTYSQTLLISTQTTAGFTANVTEGCAPFSVQFTDESSENVTAWNWTFPGGNPATSSEQSPVVVYENAGSFDVSLEVSNATTNDVLTFTNYIVVDEVPSVGFTSSVSELTVDFTNISTNATSYLWDFGDTNTSNEVDPTHTYMQDGIYTVTLSAINGCGSVMITETFTIATLPAANFEAGVTSGCVPFTVAFNDLSSENAEAWQWTFDGGVPSTSTEQNPMVTYNSTGSFNVSLTASNTAGAHTVTFTNYIVVDDVPFASFFGSLSSGSTVSFVNNSTNATSYLWEFGDGMTSTDPSPIYTYANDGTYFVTLTAINDCGSTTSNGELIVTTAPIANFSADITAECVPFEVQFTNESSANATTFVWNFPGGTPTSSMDENPLVTYNTPGVYTVIMTASNGSGSNMSTQTDLIVALDIPTANFGFSIDNQSVMFSNTSIGNNLTYAWDFGDMNTSIEENPTHFYTDPGVYTVSFTVTNPCGSTTFMETINVPEGMAPSANFSADPTGDCVPFTVNFMDLSLNNPTEWEWTFPGGDPASSIEQNPTVTYNTAGIYDVTLTASNFIGMSTFSQETFIIAADVPVADFDFTPNMGTINFTNTSIGGISYEWDFGNGDGSIEENPSYTYTESGTYLVTLTVTNPCGSTTTSTEVSVIIDSVNDLSEIAIFELYPNPNDGSFVLRLQGEPMPNLDLVFYDVLGRVHFENQVNFSSGTWTQTFDFESLATGIYLLQVQVEGRSVFKKVMVTE